MFMGLHLAMLLIPIGILLSVSCPRIVHVLDIEGAMETQDLFGSQARTRLHYKRETPKGGLLCGRSLCSISKMS